MSSEKIIFFDVDDTLIHHSSKKSYIPNSTFKTIQKLKRAGHIPVIASGRSYIHIKHIMDLLDIQNAVCFNGHMIVANHKVIYDEPLHEDEIMRLIKHIKKGLRPAIAMDDQMVYLKDLFGQVKRTLRKKVKVIEGAKANMFTDNLTKLKVDHTTYYGMMYFNVKFNLQDSYKHLAFKKWGNKGFEVANKGTSKLSGIKWLCNYLGHPEEDIVVFGDNYNDIEMLEGVEQSVAMGNAIDEAKEVASYVTDHVGNNGIEKACIYLGLI